ncbi:hypothetical protein [Actinomadura fibrosa]|uniref:Uncharacterized protein n=1 Tax=Actinomadura fibrosa TaxID=111802 RepID=A0ABW2XSP4_9ACTN|nr:hypothetical protein [Actinomadura fibrosa]
MDEDTLLLRNSEAQARADRARDRRRRAEERYEQLSRRIQELEEGRRRGFVAGVSAENRALIARRVEQACAAADQSQVEARAGYRNATRTLRRNAELHERAAALGIGDVEEHRRRAIEARREADRDERFG